MYRIRMPAADPKTYLWKNVCTLMGVDAPSIDSVQKRTGVGRGTIQRLRDGVTSIGVDNLAQIADAFGIQAWQLLTPSLEGLAQAPKTPFADLSAEESSLIAVIRIGLSDKERAQLATSVEEAVKLRVAQGTANHDLSFYFAVDRRNHTVDVVHDKREKKSWNVSSGDSPELRQVTAKKRGVSK